MLFIARLIRGERLTKATPGDKRQGASVFLFIPIVCWFFVGFGQYFFDKAGAVSIFIFLTIGFSVFFFTILFWIRTVPTKISLILAAIAWPAFLWWAWHYF
jgi:hypothetical protein